MSTTTRGRATKDRPPPVDFPLTSAGPPKGGRALTEFVDEWRRFPDAVNHFIEGGHQ